MMGIRKMRVRVSERFMPVWMAVRLFSIPRVNVFVLMVGIMHMLVCVRVQQLVMFMFVFVLFSEMQPDTQRH